MPHRFFLPKPKSRSTILSIKSLLLVNTLLLFLVGLRIVSLNYKDFHILGFATNVNVEDLLRDTNKEREDRGLNSLKYSSVLARAAEQKAKHMFANNYWNHIGPDGATPWDFMLSNGYNYTYAGENLAKDFMNSSSVVKAWINSPSHRDNLLSANYTEIGFAVVDGTLSGEDTTIVVQMFGKPYSTAKVDTVQTIGAEEPEVAVVTTEESSSLTINDVSQQPVNNEGDTAEFVVQESIKSEGSDLINVNLQYVNFFAFFILGFFTLALLIDGILAFKSKHLRLTGNTISHLILFVSAIIFIYYLKHPGII